MDLSQFTFELPDELIAQTAPAERTASRLLDTSDPDFKDRHFSDLPQLLQSGDLLVFNNTRVIPARLYAQKATGGQVEILIERVLDEQRALCHVRANKSPKVGTQFLIDGQPIAQMLARHDALFELRFEPSANAVMTSHGHMPLPKYIKREDDASDLTRYQTVYAKVPGAVAAPTAGLHFDEALLAQTREMGVEHAEVTLHVGAGTFQPIRSEAIDEHQMHYEVFEVPQATVDAIRKTRERGGRVVAVGTTVVRALESAARGGELRACCEETNLFIRPGVPFRAVDALITNFHLPKSTLLILVSAFAGHERVLAAYQHAVQNRYRFFSYGDAMFLTPDRSLWKSDEI